jgi:hypothetical protein
VQIVQIAVVFIIIGAMIYFVSRLFYMAIGGIGAVRRATAAVDKQLRQELTELSVEGLRERILRNPYLTVSLRSDANIQRFCAKIADGNEAALVAEFTKGRLYKMLVGAERSLGMTGRPEALENIDEIWAVLQELGKKSSSHTADDQR